MKLAMNYVRKPLIGNIKSRRRRSSLVKHTKNRYSSRQVSLHRAMRINIAKSCVTYAPPPAELPPNETTSSVQE